MRGVRSRHLPQAIHRSTHGGSAIDTTIPDPANTLYTSQSDVEPTDALTVGAGSVGVGAIQAGAVPAAAFAAGIRPVSIVSSLPTLPSADYPLLSYAVLTSDSRLYKNIGDVWVKGVDGADIVADSITAGQIAAGAIGASEIAIGGRQTGSSSNQILNQSFEEVSGSWVAEWFGASEAVPTGQGYEGAVSGLTYTTVTTSPKHGARYIAMAAAGTADGGSVVSKSFPVSGAEIYYVSAWAKSAVASADGLYVRVVFGSADGFQRFDAGVLFSDVASDAATTTIWTQYQGYVTVPAGKTWARLVLYWYAPATATTVNFDNVVCERVAGGLTNSTGRVLIDSSGITIQDEFGSTSLNASGFSGSWSDFLAMSLYNGRFAAGGNGVTGTAITAGRTSLLPYWTAAITGSPTFNWVIRNNSGALEIRVGSGEQVKITSDITPIRAAVNYRVSVTLELTSISGTAGFKMTPKVYWYRGDGTACTTASSTGASFTFTSVSGAFGPSEFASDFVLIPNDARLAKIEIASDPAGASAVTFYMQGVRFREIEPGISIGYCSRAYHPSHNNANIYSGSALSLAVGAAAVAPIWVPSPMLLRKYELWCTDAATARSAEIGLYYDRFTSDTGRSSLSLLHRVVGSDATFSFTPTVAAVQTSADVSGAPVAILPGYYYIIIRNTHATSTFDIGGQSNSATLLGTFSASKTSVSALSATQDLASFSGSGRLLGIGALGDSGGL